VRSDYDAIIVLAGGLTPDGGLPPWVSRRLDAGADMQRRQQTPACPLLCLGGGTPHKPAVLGASGHVLHEATACAQYLMAKGVAADSILKEVSSYDTVGCAVVGIHALQGCRPAPFDMADVEHLGMATSHWPSMRSRPAGGAAPW
jgi:hypothetical protein